MKSVRSASLLAVCAVLACAPVDEPAQETESNAPSERPQRTLPDEQDPIIDEIPTDDPGDWCAECGALEVMGGFLRGDIGPVRGLDHQASDVTVVEAGESNTIEVTVDTGSELAMTVVNIEGSLRDPVLVPGARLTFPSLSTNTSVVASVWGCTGEEYAGEDYDEPADEVIIAVEEGPEPDTRVYNYTARWFRWTAGSDEPLEVHGSFTARLPTTVTDDGYGWAPAVGVVGGRLRGTLADVRGMDARVENASGRYDGPFQSVSLTANTGEKTVHLVLSTTGGMEWMYMEQDQPETYTRANGPEVPRLAAFVGTPDGWEFRDSADELTLILRSDPNSYERREFEFVARWTASEDEVRGNFMISAE
ncbi:MAG: hypothetical protein AB2A00_33360 [Myxococcota bacterium]